MADMELDALRDELAEFAEPAAETPRSAVEERVLAGFEEIHRWVAANGRMPRNAEGLDIFERLYAVRLGRLRSQPDLRAIVAPVDQDGLLDGQQLAGADPAALSADDLAAELVGIEESASDLMALRHVRPRAEIRAAEEIASRQPCPDFDIFRPMFAAVQEQIRSGTRQTRRFGRDGSVTAGDFFVLGGQLVFIADVGEIYRTEIGAPNARLRVIYDNGTESNLLIRSLQNALYKDDTGRRVTEPDAGPLFAATAEEGDLASGTVYVLRSRSDLPAIAANRELIHKIGVTGGDVQRRITNAKVDATFLLADVEVVTTYTLYHINRTKLENLLHRFFAPGRLDITISDRFGNPVQPREWFQVPLFIIDEAIDRIRDGSITDYRYDPGQVALVRHDAAP
jgi:hypothetical protein